VTTQSKNNQIPLQLVVSLMIVTMGGILAAFLAFAGVRYGFKWPGLVKSVVSGVLLIACLTYGIKRGDRDLRLMREMPSGDKQVGIAHAGLIMLFWDDEGSYAFFIDAASESDALEWGREVSERFVTHLFKRSDWDGTIPSWRGSGFAHWIETEPLKRFSGLALETLPVIQCSNVPDFDEWIQESGFGKIANAR
jgi:hypothetical protein